jgi:branched-chain amino acid transport system permease protein
MKRTLWIILILIISALPLVLSDYSLHLLILIFLSAYLGQCWNIIGGYGGQLSLGNAIFFGAGAYCYTVLIVDWHFGALVGTLFGALIALVLALLIGLPTFRYQLKGVYFVMATIAFAEIARIIVLNAPSLGAAEGISLPFDGSSIWVISKMPHYYTILSLLVGVTLFVRLLARRYVGLSLTLLRESEEVAEASGVNVLNMKVVALVASGVGTALGGVFQARYLLYVHPDSVFGVPLSIQMAAVAIVGGRKSLMGPIIGAVLLVPLAEYSRAMVGFGGRGLHQLLYGLVIVLASLFFANGIMPMLEGAWKNLRGRYVRRNSA